MEFRKGEQEWGEEGEEGEEEEQTTAAVEDFQLKLTEFDLNSFKQNFKVGSKLNIQKTKIMASGPITSWQRDGETVAPDVTMPRHH